MQHKRPVRDDVLIAHKFICGNKFPPPKYARPERDEMIFITSLFVYQRIRFLIFPMTVEGKRMGFLSLKSDLHLMFR